LKRSGASTAMVAALFIVGLLIGAVGVYAATSSSAKTTTVTGPGVTETSTVATTETVGAGVTVTSVSTATQVSTVTTTLQGTAPSLGTVTIGVLTDLSDGLSSEGVRVQAYTEQAVSDVNAWVQNTSWAGKVTFKVDVEDYALNPTTADTELKSMAASGISVVVGPLNSGAAEAILSDADSLHVVLVSPSSTSPALAIPSTPGNPSYLFRTAPDDRYQGQADATEMYGQGVRGLIIVYRDDTYGDGLYNYTSLDFGNAGGSGVTIDAIPYSSTATSFTNILPTISSDYNALVAKYGANAVAIDAISFEEIGYLLQEASTQYPSLLSTPQPWYGTDGEQGDTNLVNSTYGAFMQDIRMPATVFGYDNTSKTAQICADFASNPSLSCDSYALGSYDDVWLAALSVLDCGANSGPCIQKVFASVADSYFGATGWTQLTVGQDRLGGNFQIWCVESPPAGENWYLCGSWSSLTNTIAWVPGQQPST